MREELGNLHGGKDLFLGGHNHEAQANRGRAGEACVNDPSARSSGHSEGEGGKGRKRQRKGRKRQRKRQGGIRRRRFEATDACLSALRGTGVAARQRLRTGVFRSGRLLLPPSSSSSATYRPSDLPTSSMAYQWVI